MVCQVSIKERFSIESRETKSKVDTLANHKGDRQSSEPINTRNKYTFSTRSAGKPVRARNGFGLTTDWITKWRENFLLANRLTQ